MLFVFYALRTLVRGLPGIAACIWHKGDMSSFAPGKPPVLCPADVPGAPHAVATNDLIGINSSLSINVALVVGLNVFGQRADRIASHPLLAAH